MSTTDCTEPTHSGVIYGLHNGDFDLRYIGKTIRNPKNRLAQHRGAARRGEKYAVASWIRKHGEDNIHMLIIETFDSETIHLIDEREIFHIAQARAYSTGENLNMANGGGGCVGVPVSDAVRAASSARMTARLQGNTIRRGTTMSAESRAKMSLAGRGKPKSAEHRAAISAASKVRPPKAQHTRWHVNRNVINPDCQLCVV